MNPWPTDLPGLGELAASYLTQIPDATQAHESYDTLFALDGLPSQVQGLERQVTAGQDHVSHPLNMSQGIRYNGGSSHDAQALSATSMGPPTKTRRRKAPTLRAEDWEPYKARILELHVTQGLPLPTVKEKIKEEFGFSAEYDAFFKLRQVSFIC